MGKKYAKDRAVPADVAGAVRERRGVYLDDEAARFIRAALNAQKPDRLPSTKRQAKAVKGGSRGRRRGR